MLNKVFYTFLLLLNTLNVFGQNSGKTFLFVGTYTAGKPDSGIFVYEFNTNTGQLKQVGSGDSLTNPSFLSMSPNGKYLYACTDSKLPKHGNVASFKIDSVNGKISFINKQSCGGENPVYLSVHKSNKYVANANYTEGNVTIFTTNTDGSLNTYSQNIQFKDSSINKIRQDKAHIHSAVFSPQNDFIFLPDLGADKIRTFKFDTLNSAPLVLTDDLTIKTISGSGPRHFVFHSSGKFAYCIEELSGTVSAYSYSSGKLNTIQRVFSYSKQHEAYAGADIHVSPDGLFLYASNRDNNENTISIFSINQITGKLKLLEHQPTFGEHPRNFTVDPSGNFLLVANTGTNNIVVFKRNLKTGLLSKTQNEIKVPRPSCLQMRTYNGSN